MSSARLLCFAGVLAVSALSLHAGSVTVPVDAKAMPWLWDNAALNTSYQFGVQDGTAPTVVSGGVSFVPGTTLVITYLSGLTDAFGGAPVVDGKGYGVDPPSPFPFDASDTPGSTGQFFPSLYMDSGSYPIYLNALVGAFVDAGGNILPPPFVINNGPTSVVVPVGAVALQLGINDDFFGDNQGALSANIRDASAVPEPSAFLLLGFPLALTALAHRRRQPR
jgi:hypothetical protein